MRKQIVITSVAAFMLLTLGLASAQTSGNKIGIGMNLGVNRLYGDRGSQGSENIGFGTEAVLSYRILPFLELAYALGYGQVRYDDPLRLPQKTTDFVNSDLKGNFEVLPNSRFSPYASVGLGALWYAVRNQGFGRVWDAEFFGGGGLRYRASSSFDIYLGADYRYITSDTFDNQRSEEGSSDDGYFNVRSGFTYRLGSGRDNEGVIAGQEVPFYEIDEEPGIVDPEYAGMQAQTSRQNIAGGQQSPKDMTEYVKLKSRIDDLSQKVDTREKEISVLQRDLGQRRRVLSSLENKVSAQGPVAVRTSSSMSGFSEIYEKALTHFYNQNYSQAISMFDLLLSQYANHSLASNCQFWIAQSHLGMSQYPQAIEEFTKVLAFERSFKKDDALFHVGKTYLQIGSGDMARSAFTQLIQQFPYSEFLDEAKGYVARL